MKAPAFLFYSRDFYEGTRTMLPEERACYIDLLIYQHQNEFIPNDIKRISMYCSGIDISIVEATLEAKFKLTSKGWINNRLSEVMEDRKEFADKQSVNGQVGQFFKKAKSILNSKDFNKIRSELEGISNDQKLDLISERLKDSNDNLEAMLQSMLKHLADANANEVNSLTILDREVSFRDSLSEYVEQYGKEMVRNFYDYWREQNKDGTKMRFESEKFFNVKMRLSRWNSNNKKKFGDKKVLPKGEMIQTADGGFIEKNELKRLFE